MAILVAEFKSWSTLSKDDRLILINTVGKNCSVAYILSLGKSSENYKEVGLTILDKGSLLGLHF